MSDYYDDEGGYYSGQRSYAGATPERATGNGRALDRILAAGLPKYEPVYKPVKLPRVGAARPGGIHYEPETTLTWREVRSDPLPQPPMPGLTSNRIMPKFGKAPLVASGPQPYQPSGFPERISITPFSDPGEGLIEQATASPWGPALALRPGDQKGGFIEGPFGFKIATTPMTIANAPTWGREGLLALASSVVGGTGRYEQPAGAMFGEQVQGPDQKDWNPLDYVIEGMNVVGDAVWGPFDKAFKWWEEENASNRGKELRSLAQTGAVQGGSQNLLSFMTSRIFGNDRLTAESISLAAMKRGASWIEMAAKMYDLDPAIVQEIVANPAISDEDLREIVKGQALSTDPFVNITLSLGVQGAMLIAGGAAVKGLGAALKAPGVLSAAGGGGRVGQVATGIEKLWRVNSAYTLSGWTVRGGEWAVKQIAGTFGNQALVDHMDRLLWEMPTSTNPGLNLIDGFGTHMVRRRDLTTGKQTWAGKQLLKGQVYAGTGESAFGLDIGAAVRGRGMKEVLVAGERPIETLRIAGEAIPTPQKIGQSLARLSDVTLDQINERVFSKLGWSPETIKALAGDAQLDDGSFPVMTVKDIKNGLLYHALAEVRDRLGDDARALNPALGIVQMSREFTEAHLPEAVKLLEDALVKGKTEWLTRRFQETYWNRGTPDASELGAIPMYGDFDSTIALIQFRNWMVVSKEVDTAATLARAEGRAIVREDWTLALSERVDADRVARAKLLLKQNHGLDDAVSAHTLNRIRISMPSLARVERLSPGPRKGWVPKITRRELESILDKQLVEVEKIRADEARYPTGQRAPITPDDLTNQNIEAMSSATAMTPEMVRELLPFVEAEGTEPPPRVPEVIVRWAAEHLHRPYEAVARDPLAAAMVAVRVYNDRITDAVIRGGVKSGLEEFVGHLRRRPGSPPIEEAIAAAVHALDQPPKDDWLRVNQTAANLWSETLRETVDFMGEGGALGAWLDDPASAIRVVDIGGRPTIVPNGSGVADLRAANDLLARFRGVEGASEAQLQILSDANLPVWERLAAVADLADRVELTADEKVVLTTWAKQGPLLFDDELRKVIGETEAGEYTAADVAALEARAIARDAEVAELAGLTEQYANRISSRPGAGHSNDLEDFMTRARAMGVQTIDLDTTASGATRKGVTLATARGVIRRHRWENVVVRLPWQNVRVPMAPRKIAAEVQVAEASARGAVHQLRLLDERAARLREGLPDDRVDWNPTPLFKGSKPKAIAYYQDLVARQPTIAAKVVRDADTGKHFVVQERIRWDRVNSVRGDEAAAIAARDAYRAAHPDAPIVEHTLEYTKGGVQSWVIRQGEPLSPEGIGGEPPLPPAAPPPEAPPGTGAEAASAVETPTSVAEAVPGAPEPVESGFDAAKVDEISDRLHAESRDRIIARLEKLGDKRSEAQTEHLAQLRAETTAESAPAVDLPDGTVARVVEQTPDGGATLYPEGGGEPIQLTPDEAGDVMPVPVEARRYRVMGPGVDKSGTPRDLAYLQEDLRPWEPGDKGSFRWIKLPKTPDKIIEYQTKLLEKARQKGDEAAARHAEGVIREQEVIKARWAAGDLDYHPELDPWAQHRGKLAAAEEPSPEELEAFGGVTEEPGAPEAAALKEGDPIVVNGTKYRYRGVQNGQHTFAIAGSNWKQRTLSLSLPMDAAMEWDATAGVWRAEAPAPPPVQAAPEPAGPWRAAYSPQGGDAWAHRGGSMYYRRVADRGRPSERVEYAVSVPPATGSKTFATEEAAIAYLQRKDPAAAADWIARKAPEEPAAPVESERATAYAAMLDRAEEISRRRVETGERHPDMTPEYEEFNKLEPEDIVRSKNRLATIDAERTIRTSDPELFEAIAEKGDKSASEIQKKMERALGEEEWTPEQVVDWYTTNRAYVIEKPAYPAGGGGRVAEVIAEKRAEAAAGEINAANVAGTGIPVTLELAMANPDRVVVNPHGYPYYIDDHGNLIDLYKLRNSERGNRAQFDAFVKERMKALGVKDKGKAAYTEAALVNVHRARYVTGFLPEGDPLRAKIDDLSAQLIASEAELDSIKRGQTAKLRSPYEITDELSAAILEAQVRLWPKQPEPQMGMFDQPPARPAGLEAIVADAKAKSARLDALAAAGERPIEVPRSDGQGSILVGPDVRRPGMWMSGYIDPDGTPTGHVEADSYREALENVRGFADVEAIEAAHAAESGRGAETGFPDPYDETKQIPAIFRVMELDDLISDDQPGYRTELQPRDREGRITSAEQVADMAQKMTTGAKESARLMLRTESGAEGAFVVDPAGHVIAGNGRARSMRAAGEPMSEAMKAALVKRAAEFGVDPDVVRGMKYPVLAREVPAELASPQLAAALNVATGGMAITETASRVAKEITPEAINGLELEKVGSFAEALNSERGRQFSGNVLRILTKSEQKQYLDAKGNLNQQGVQLIQAATVAKLMRDPASNKIVAAFFETPDADVARIRTGLLGAMGQLLSAHAKIEAGVRYPQLAIGDALARATLSIMDLRGQGQGGKVLAQTLDSPAMFEDATTMFDRELARTLVALNSAPEVTSFLRSYAKAVEESADPAQLGFLDIQPSKLRIGNAAIADINNAREAAANDAVAKRALAAAKKGDGMGLVEPETATWEAIRPFTDPETGDVTISAPVMGDTGIPHPPVYEGQPSTPELVGEDLVRRVEGAERVVFDEWIGNGTMPEGVPVTIRTTDPTWAALLNRMRSEDETAFLLSIGDELKAYMAERKIGPYGAEIGDPLLVAQDAAAGNIAAWMVQTEVRRLTRKGPRIEADGTIVWAINKAELTSVGIGPLVDRAWRWYREAVKPSELEVVGPDDLPLATLKQTEAVIADAHPVEVTPLEAEITGLAPDPEATVRAADLDGTPAHVVTTDADAHLAAALKAKAGALPTPPDPNRPRPLEFHRPSETQRLLAIEAQRIYHIGKLSEAQEALSRMRDTPAEVLEDVPWLADDPAMADIYSRYVYSGIPEEANPWLDVPTTLRPPERLSEIVGMIDSIDKGIHPGIDAGEASALRGELMALAERALEQAGGEPSSAALRRLERTREAIRKARERGEAIEVIDDPVVLPTALDDLANLLAGRMEQFDADPLDGFAGYQLGILPRRSKFDRSPLSPRLQYRDLLGEYKDLIDQAEATVPGLGDELLGGPIRTLARHVEDARFSRGIMQTLDMLFGARSERALAGQSIQRWKDDVFRLVEPVVANMDDVDRDLDAVIKGLHEYMMTTSVFKLPQYRRINSIFQRDFNAVAAKVLTERGGTVPAWFEVVDAQPGGLAQVWRRADNRFRAFLSDRSPGLVTDMDRLWFNSRVGRKGGSIRRGLVVGYNLWRFTFDLRWQALEYLESDALLLGRDGLTTYNRYRQLQGGWRAPRSKIRSDRGGATRRADTGAQPGIAAPKSSGGGAPVTPDMIPPMWSALDRAKARQSWAWWASQADEIGLYTRARDNAILAAMRKEAPEIFEDELVRWARQDPILQDALQSFGETPEKWVERLARDWEAFEVITDPAAWARLKAGGRQKLLSRYGKELAGKDASKLAAKEAYPVIPEIERAIAESRGDPRVVALYERLREINNELYDDLAAVFYGQPDRSNMQRILNHPLLYWPISYQIKSTKWLARIMFDKAFGVETGFTGALVIQKIHDEHAERWKVDAEYRKAFERHRTLLFMAQMILPITPFDIGVSLSPFTKYALHLGQADEYSRNIFAIGPGYSYFSLFPRMIFEENKPGGIFESGVPGPLEFAGNVAEQVFPLTIKVKPASQSQGDIANEQVTSGWPYTELAQPPPANPTRGD